MKRIITYLYEYQNGIRRGSAGVFKLDLLGEECRIQLNLQGSIPVEEQGTVYFVVKHEEGELTGVSVGKTSRYRGTSGGNWVVRQNGICSSRYSFDDVHGMAVRYSSGRYLASCWEEKADERFLRGDFAEEKEQTEKADERSLRSDFIEQKFTKETEADEYTEAAEYTETAEYIEASENPKVVEELEDDEYPETAENSEMVENLENIENPKLVENREDIGNLGVVEDLEAIEDNPDTMGEWKPDGNSETSRKTGRNSDELYAEELPGTAPKETLQRMDISDIRSLPKKNWHLCSNSFLIHGFFSYHYLVRKDVEEDGVIKSYLGVPGIYARSERAMAMLFGFPEFEEERHISKNSIRKEQAVNGHSVVEDRTREDEAKEDRITEYKAEEDKESSEKESKEKSIKKPQILEGSFGYWFCQLEM